MRCELCRRDVPIVTEHHLVPRQKGGGPEHVAELCPACHRQVHALFDNATLADELATVEALRRHPQFRRFVRWVRKQDPGKRITVRSRKR